MGFRLFAAMRGDETLRVFSESCTRCPFMTHRGLCCLQLKKGHDFIPETCRLYPRSVIRHMDHTEYHLDLSCVHAAELFLKSRREQRLIEGTPEYCDKEELGRVAAHSDKEAYRCVTEYSIEKIRDKDPESNLESDPAPYGNNEDASYLEALLDLREEVLTALRGVSAAEELDALLRKIGVFLAKIQEETLLTGRSTLKKGAFSEYHIEGGENSDTGPFFPLPIVTINELMSTDLFDNSLRFGAHYLYRLCRLYYKRFDKLTPQQGQVRWDDLFRMNVAEDDGAVVFYSDYIASVLLRYMTESFEDYSLYLHFEDALIAGNLLLLFRLLFLEEKGTLTKEDDAMIISAMEKRLFHNEKVQKQLRLALTESGARGYDRKTREKKT